MANKMITSLFFLFFSLRISAQSYCQSFYGKLADPNPLSQDPLSSRYFNTKSSEFLEERKNLRANKLIKDRLTGEMLTKEEIYERQKKSMGDPLRYGEDPLTGIPIDLKSPLYKIIKEIKNVTYLKWRTGHQLAPWEWLSYSPVPNNVKESVSYLVAEYLNTRPNLTLTTDTIKQIGIHHKISEKEVLEETFRCVRGKIQDLEAEEKSPKVSEYKGQLKALDLSLQRELRAIYDKN
ncbi:MAG: hypothetical protein ACXVLQ_09165 [Bacteriovorax sp.]